MGPTTYLKCRNGNEITHLSVNHVACIMPECERCFVVRMTDGTEQYFTSVTVLVSFFHPNLRTTLRQEEKIATNP